MKIPLVEPGSGGNMTVEDRIAKSSCCLTVYRTECMIINIELMLSETLQRILNGHRLARLAIARNAN